MVKIEFVPYLMGLLHTTMGHSWSVSKQARTGQDVGLFPKHAHMTYPSERVFPVKCPSCHSFTHIREWLDSDHKVHRIYLCHYCFCRESMTWSKKKILSKKPLLEGAFFSPFSHQPLRLGINHASLTRVRRPKA